MLNEFNERFDELLPVLLELKEVGNNTFKIMLDKLKVEYLKGKSYVGKKNAQGFINVSYNLTVFFRSKIINVFVLINLQMFSDRLYKYPYFKSISNYLQYSNLDRNPMNLFKFNFKGPISYSMKLTRTAVDLGVTHMDDQLYLVRNVFFKKFPKDSCLAELIRTMTKLYVNFALYG